MSINSIGISPGGGRRVLARRLARAVWRLWSGNDHCPTAVPGKAQYHPR